MKGKFFRRLALVVLAVSSLAPTHALAGTASLYLSPGSKTLTTGATLSVAIRLSTDDNVNAVKAVLSYPADKLDFLSVSDSGSAFNIAAKTTGGGGSVQVDRGIIGTVTGDVLVATVNFRVSAGSGSGSVLFSGGSAAVRASDNANILAGTSGGTYYFTTPSSGGGTPAPKPKTSGGSTSSPSAPTDAAPAAPPPDTAPPKLTNIRASSSTQYSITVEWDTDEPSTSTVEYGVNTSYGIVASSDGMLTHHKVTFSTLLLPTVTYKYRVKSIDGAGNAAYSDAQSATTKGYPVTIRVVDTKGKLVKNAKVTLAKGVRKTDSNGLASFANLSPGKTLVVVDANGHQTSKTIEILESIKDGKVLDQQFDVTVPQSSYNLLLLIMAGIIQLLIAALYFTSRHYRLMLEGVRARRAKRKNKNVPEPVSHPQEPPIEL